MNLNYECKYLKPIEFTYGKHNIKGAGEYMDPLLFEKFKAQNFYSKTKCDIFKCDIFSLGVVLIELASGKRF